MTVVTSEIPLHAPKTVGGGQTIAKHVEKTLAFLQKRFASKKVQFNHVPYFIVTAFPIK
jgi:hypothetical protein